jgi:hypothetical protein
MCTAEKVIDGFCENYFFSECKATTCELHEIYTPYPVWKKCLIKFGMGMNFKHIHELHMDLFYCVHFIDIITWHNFECTQMFNYKVIKLVCMYGLRKHHCKRNT